MHILIATELERLNEEFNLDRLPDEYRLKIENHVRQKLIDYNGRLNFLQSQNKYIIVENLKIFKDVEYFEVEWTNGDLTEHDCFTIDDFEETMFFQSKSLELQPWSENPNEVVVMIETYEFYIRYYPLIDDQFYSVTYLDYGVSDDPDEFKYFGKFESLNELSDFFSREFFISIPENDDFATNEEQVVSFIKPALLKFVEATADEQDTDLIDTQFSEIIAKNFLSDKENHHFHEQAFNEDWLETLDYDIEGDMRFASYLYLSRLIDAQIENLRLDTEVDFLKVIPGRWKSEVYDFFVNEVIEGLQEFKTKTKQDVYYNNQTSESKTLEQLKIGLSKMFDSLNIEPKQILNKVNNSYDVIQMQVNMNREEFNNWATEVVFQNHLTKMLDSGELMTHETFMNHFNSLKEVLGEEPTGLCFENGQDVTWKLCDAEYIRKNETDLGYLDEESLKEEFMWMISEPKIESAPPLTAKTVMGSEPTITTDPTMDL